MMWRGAYPHEMPIIEEYAKGWASRSAERWTADAIMRDIAAGERQAWVCDNGEIMAAALTRFAPPNVYIDACSGRNRQAWQDALNDTIAQWTRDIGGRRIISFMRPGWKRAAELRGWRMAHVEMIREV